MPSSDPIAKAVLMEYVKKCGIPHSVFDIGMGAGEYGLLFKAIDLGIVMIGLEIFPGYIKDDWGYSKLYDKIYIGDMRTFDYSLIDVELVIAADVIEHVIKPEGIETVEKLKKRYRWVLVTLPVMGFIQGSENEYGNVHEEHKHQWKREEAVGEMGLRYVGDAGVCGLLEWRKIDA